MWSTAIVVFVDNICMLLVVECSGYFRFFCTCVVLSVFLANFLPLPYPLLNVTSTCFMCLHLGSIGIYYILMGFFFVSCDSTDLTYLFAFIYNLYQVSFSITSSSVYVYPLAVDSLVIEHSHWAKLLRCSVDLQSSRLDSAMHAIPCHNEMMLTG